jgi:hypothetical protein
MKPLSVGTKVRVEREAGFSCVSDVDKATGLVGNILKVDSSDQSYNVGWSDGTTGWYGWHEVDPENFQLDDRVRVVSSKATKNYHYFNRMMMNYVGHEGTVILRGSDECEFYLVKFEDNATWTWHRDDLEFVHPIEKDNEQEEEEQKPNKLYVLVNIARDLVLSSNEDYDTILEDAKDRARRNPDARLGIFTFTTFVTSKTEVKVEELY